MKINHFTVELLSAEVETTIRFYQTLLDMETVATEVEDDGRTCWALLHHGSFRLSIKDERKMRAEVDYPVQENLGSTIGLCIQVSDIRETYTEVADKMATLNHPHLTPCGATSFSLRDNNGYVITFEQF